MKNLSFICSAGLVLTACIWGFAFVVVKDSLDFIGPYWMVALRFTIAALCLSLIYIRNFRKFNKKIICHGILLGIFLFLAYVVQTVGCKYTTAGKNAFLTTIYVILVPVLGWPVLKKTPRWYTWAAAVLSLTGIGLLSLSGNEIWYKMNKGDALTLICGVMYALHIIFGAKYVAEDDPILLTIVQFFVSGILGLLISPIFDDPLSASVFLSSKILVSILYLGLLSSMVCFVLQNVCLKYVPSALASLFLSLESVFGVLFSSLFLHEVLSGKMWFGCGLIFAAILISEVLPGILEKSVD